VRIEPDLTPDSHVGMFAIVLAMGSALVSTVGPALRSAWRENLGFLRSGERKAGCTPMRPVGTDMDRNCRPSQHPLMCFGLRRSYKIRIPGALPEWEEKVAPALLCSSPLHPRFRIAQALAQQRRMNLSNSPDNVL
jgi:hypothetical protein